MRKLLFITVLAAAIAMSVGWAWARTAVPIGGSAAVPAPLDVPKSMPRSDGRQPGAYGFRSSDSIARSMQAAAAPGAAHAANSAGSATVTVTATVLPVVTIIADDLGVHEIWINTPERRPLGVLYIVRTSIEDGAVRELDAATWSKARTALAEARVGTGQIWSK